MSKIKKGDNVKMLSGKDRGKNGTVSLVLAQGADARVVIEGLNKVKKHQRARKQGQKGQIISVERPVNISSVQLICKSCGKPTRVGFKVDGDKKERICRKCSATI
ncbi:MAG: 50S ribosomal protein L24 [bacterium]|nr:50S ribosomal protein L24 [bacterium]